MNALYIVFAALFGLCAGSFGNVLIYRVPRDESFVQPSSYCPACGETLKPWHLIPVFSWIFLRGKCAFCKGRVSPRYMAVELLTAVLFAAMAWRFPQDVIFYCALMTFLVPIAFIDFETQEIPVFLLVGGGVSGLAMIVWRSLELVEIQPLIDGALGAALGFGALFVIDLLCRLIAKKPGFGYGDMALMGVCGLFMSVWDVAAAYFLAVVMGGIWAAVLIARKKRGTYFAFGPYLCVGVILQMLTQYRVWG